MDGESMEKRKKAKKTLLMVSHTHWDREWYLTFEEFRLRLLKVIQKALYMGRSEDEWDSFMLDGQTSPLEDYLQVKPHDAGLLKDAISAGKLVVGPWYVLADEFLESAEGLIRNLLIGHEVAGSFGSPMKVGYVPDTFGHVWQLPQILQGFGIKSAYLFRGYPPLFGGYEEYDGHNDGTPLEFFWKSPDGSMVLTLHHVTGYGNAANLDESVGDVGEYRYIGPVSKILMSIDAMEKRSRQNVLLLMNGTDHLYPDEHLPGIIDFFNHDEELSESMQLVHGKLSDYFSMLSRESGDLPTLSGEMRGSAYTQVTPACLSTRMYLKQQNWLASNLLESYVEPLNTLAWYLGIEYPHDELTFAWKKILLNHPHDSICGCSIDRVHDDMETRFSEVIDMVRVLKWSAMNYIGKALQVDGENRIPIIVFNVTNWVQTGPVSLLENLGAVFRGKKLNILDSDGNRVERATIEMVDDYRVLVDGDRLYPRLDRPFSATKIEFIATDVPSFGYKTYFVCESIDNTPVDGGVTSPDEGDEHVLENEFLKVTIYPSGIVELLDKRSGVEWKDLLTLEDAGDDGDEYDYAPPHGDDITVYSRDFLATIQSIRESNVKQECSVSITMQVPMKIDGNRKRSTELGDLGILVNLCLYSGEPVLRATLTVDNRIEDHRLRVLFPTRLRVKSSFAADHFMVMERDIDLPRDDGWYQPAQGLYHTDGFVDLSDGTNGLAIHVRGLPEFEVLKDGATTAITLFRSVGYLSRDGLPISQGHLGRPSGLNGPFLPTPGAQCKRRMTFDLAIQPHAGDWVRGDVYKFMKAFHSPLEGIARTGSKFYYEPRDELARSRNLNEMEESLVIVEPGTLVVSAIKKAGREDGIIIRVFNPSSAPVQGTIKLSFAISSASIVDLKEDFLESIFDADDGKFEVDFKPFQIKTYLVIPKRFVKQRSSE
ncbi:MAG: alpha-mannosidase [Promethearchaeota archaeon]